MLKALVANSLHARALVVALAGILLYFGIRTVRETPMDVFPEFAPPMVEVQTEAPGLSAEEVESLVTVPLENALNGVAWLETIRSKSVQGLSAVRLILEADADPLRARQLVQERLAVAQTRLPAVARPPVILSPLSSTSRAMKIGLSSTNLSQMELSDLALWTIRPRLMAVPGVANVAIWGQRDRQFQVLVDPARLQAHGLSLNQITNAAGAAASIDSGGFIDTPNQRIAVTHRSALRTADDLAAAPVALQGGVPLRLGDVAEVRIGHPPPIGDAVINDGPGILLIVEKQPWGNTLDVTRRVESVLAALAPGLRGVEVDSTIFRPATFIEDSLANLAHAMWLACILVVIVLGLFLFDWRTALISLLAIPLSLLAALVVLHWWGGTINTMILAGLVIAVGEVVDDAIIDVENITRRLRLNAAAANPRPAFRVILDASLEVRSAVVFASLIVVVVFLPVFFLDGLAGTFFRPLAYSYVLAILSSLLVALTLTPALCLILLGDRPQRERDPLVTRLLKAGYRVVLPWFARRPVLAAITLVGSLAGAGFAATRLGEQFLPDFKERDFLMHWVEKPGASVESMTRITTEVSRELRAIEGVRNFGSHIGRAEVADEVVGPNFTELWISMDRDVDYDATLRRINEVIYGYPGLYRDVLTYLRERVKEVLTGTSAAIVIRIYGPDLEVLRGLARRVRDAVENVEGISNLKVEQQVNVPQIQVRLKTEVAAQFGLTAAGVRAAAATLIKGLKVGEVFEEQKIYAVTVWGAPETRADPQALRELLIETPLGGSVPLGDVADIEIVPTPNAVVREGASRRIDVSCNVSGADLGKVAREIEKQALTVEFPRGYHPEFLGEYAAREASRARLFALGIVSVIAILVLLHVDFQSVRLTLLVALSLPFALIGGVAGAWLSGGVLSIGSLVGFVTVLGIAARNAIMLVSHYRHLETEEGEPFGPKLILRGAEERLAPILMTALTAALALLPLVLAGNVPGHEIEYPMAVVILGGLVSSTILNLFLMPAFYAALGRPAKTPATRANPGARP